MNLDQLKLLAYTEINKYIDETITFYRLDSYTKNIYSETNSRIYDDPIGLVAIISKNMDVDMMENIGRLNSDEMLVNIPIKEIEDKLVVEPTLNDKVQYRGKFYSIIELWPSGVVFTGPIMFRMMLKENPDLVE